MFNNSSFNDQLQQLHLSTNHQLAQLKPDTNGFLLPDVLDGMVSQLKMIKSSIYNEQVDNNNNNGNP